MPQTVEATIDALGHVTLREKIRLKGKHNALVTILDEVELPDDENSKWSLFGSVEILDDDLESASREIADMFKRSIERSANEVNSDD